MSGSYKHKIALSNTGSVTHITEKFIVVTSMIYLCCNICKKLQMCLFKAWHIIADLTIFFVFSICHVPTNVCN